MDSINATAILGFLSITLWLLIAVVASIFLFTAYGRTKMSGFLWLFGAVIVWPTVVRLFSLVIAAFTRTIMTERGLTAHAMGSVYQGISLVETLIGGVLLVVATGVLGAEARKRLATTPLAFTPTYPATPPPYTGPEASITR